MSIFNVHSFKVKDKHYKSQDGVSFRKYIKLTWSIKNALKTLLLWSNFHCYLFGANRYNGKKNENLNAKTRNIRLGVVFTRMQTTLWKSKLYSQGGGKRDVCITQVKQSLRDKINHRIQWLPRGSANLSVPEK